MNRGFGTAFVIGVGILSLFSGSAYAIPGGRSTDAYPFVENLLIFSGRGERNGELRASDAISSCTATYLNARTLITDGHCVCGSSPSLGVVDPTTQKVIRVARQAFIYDYPRRAVSTISENCERWDGPPVNGTALDVYDGTDVDIGVVELEHELKQPLLAEEYPMLPELQNESPSGEYAFVGYGYGEVGWVDGGFRFSGEKSIRRAARIHVQRVRDFDYAGRTAQAQTYLFPAIYLRIKGGGEVDVMRPQSDGGHDLMAAPGDSGGPLLRDGVIWAIASGYASSVDRLAGGNPEVLGIKNFATSLSSPLAQEFFSQLKTQGYSLDAH